MKIVFYCQHVLGMGHYFRSLEIVRALAKHEVIFVTGGPDAPAAPGPGVRIVRLPALRMDADFKAVSVAGERDAQGEEGALPESAEAALKRVKDERRRILLALFRDERPDVFFVELYPFGRKAFEFELLPVLEAVRRGDFGKVFCACGLRDILVEKKDQEKFEKRALARLNALFDGLVVHSDPGLFPLEATFSRVPDITVRMAYAGYVAQDPGPLRGGMRRVLGVAPGRKLVTVSAGGGKVGGEVLAAALDASRVLQGDCPLSLRLFTGPYAEEADFAALRERAAGLEDAVVERFSPDFPAILAETDLSLSMAGYNTVMALLRAKTPALVLPFTQNREQGMRAARLAGMGLLGVLGESDLEPAKLAARMGQILRQGRPDRPADIDLNGAANTAAILENWVSEA